MFIERGCTIWWKHHFQLYTSTYFIFHWLNKKKLNNFLTISLNFLKFFISSDTIKPVISYICAINQSIEHRVIQHYLTLISLLTIFHVSCVHCVVHHVYSQKISLPNLTAFTFKTYKILSNLWKLITIMSLETCRISIIHCFLHSVTYMYIISHWRWYFSQNDRIMHLKNSEKSLLKIRNRCTIVFMFSIIYLFCIMDFNNTHIVKICKVHVLQYQM